MRMVSKINQAPPRIRMSDVLQQTELLTGDDAEANRAAVASHQNHYDLADALEILLAADLLAGESAQDNFDAVADHPKLENVTRALRLLHVAGCLIGDDAQANLDVVAEHENPRRVARVLTILTNLGLLTGDAGQANFNAVLKYQAPEKSQDLGYVADVLQVLQSANLLGDRIDQSQTRFNHLMAYQAILLDRTMRTLWIQIPPNRLTDEHWSHIIRLCRANTVNPTMGRQHFVRYIQQELLGMDFQQQQAFNHAQSTHTASVHQTVSESALRLKARYEDSIGDLSETLQTIEIWVHAQEGHEAEQRAIQRLKNSSYNFEDPTSGVTTKELLVLVWAAIHDDSTRVGDLVDAEALFLDGLYDIQRAYNLSDTFEDRPGEDKTACASGTFNKLIEKLVGVHPDAQMKFVTRQGAMHKLLPLIREVATQYLENYQEEISVEALKQTIRPRVEERLYFEYGQDCEALTKGYDTFESFQASDKYELFCRALQNQQDEHLDLMIEGKLLMANEELDSEIERLIRRRTETVDKPETSEELRARRLRYFNSEEKKGDEDDHEFPDKPSNKPVGI